MSIGLKERILQTASELFYSQGIKATGVDAIVKAAGTTKMSLYKYFPSKDDLVLAHLQKSGTEMQARIIRGVDHRTSKPKEKLLAVFDVFAELLCIEGFRGCPFINASAEYAGDAHAVLKASADFYDGFRRSLTDIAAEAMAIKPEELASQLTLLIAGAIVTEQMKKDSGAMTTARQAAKILIEQCRQESDENMPGDR
ncbi:MAG: TetR/AcrR family transcriptional regulator [Gammaproteobacteria bacterium]